MTDKVVHRIKRVSGALPLSARYRVGLSGRAFELRRLPLERLSHIRTNVSAQHEGRDYETHVDEIERGFRAGDRLPPVELIDGRLRDGNHRLTAARRIGRAWIDAIVAKHATAPAGGDPQAALARLSDLLGVAELRIELRCITRGAICFSEVGSPLADYHERGGRVFEIEAPIVEVLCPFHEISAELQEAAALIAEHARRIDEAVERVAITECS